MHPNRTFRKTDPAHTLEFARQRGFGVLSVNGENGPVAAHVPFVISPDGMQADMHLVRSNPLLAALETAQPALLAVSGPDAYISPDWYGIADQVPTWNYVAVHLRGELRRLPQEEILDSITRLSRHFEARLAPKTPWKLDKVAPEKLAKMTRMIVPLRLEIRTMDSTWKLGQNKPDGAMDGAAQGLQTSDIGQETGAMVTLLRQLSD